MQNSLTTDELGLAVFIGVIFVSEGISARQMHVSKAGSDSASGSYAQPYLTINNAASAAQPGDTVTVHAGTYREWVKPIRGGASESKRITYRAAPGEAFYERKTAQEVKEGEYTWHCQADENVTTVWANFGKANPNTELTEINVRESLFTPEITGLKYITVDGFHFMHAAANWAPPGLDLQPGAVGPRMGKYWIIENCAITNPRCVGIILGYAPGGDYRDIDAYIQNAKLQQINIPKSETTLLSGSLIGWIGYE
jgi:hypothetical protein